MATTEERTKTLQPGPTGNYGAVEQNSGCQQPSGGNENTKNGNTETTGTQTGGETQASSEGKHPSSEEVRAWWKTALDTFNCCYKGVDTSLDIVHEVEK